MTPFQEIYSVCHSVLVISYLEASLANLTNIVSQQASKIQEIDESKYTSPLNKYGNIPKVLCLIKINQITIFFLSFKTFLKSMRWEKIIKTVRKSTATILAWRGQKSKQ